MTTERRLWTREELILAFNLYLKLPFGKLDQGTKEVKELAVLINRTSGSVAMRLNNFAAVDPFHQQRGIGGLPGGRKQVEPIFQEFINNRETLLFESERILANFEHITIEEKFKDDLRDISNLQGENRIREVKTRVNQHVFRQIVMANYNNTCAVSGIDISDFLIASHIIPWNTNEHERLNPENGICLSSLYDKAFDKGFITINEKFEILLSSHLKKEIKKNYYEKFFGPFEGKCIIHPKKYLPKKAFLEFHYDVVFKK